MIDTIENKASRMAAMMILAKRYNTSEHEVFAAIANHNHLMTADYMELMRDLTARAA